MKAVFSLIAGGNTTRFVRISLISVFEALFGAVPYLVLYFILCDIIDGMFTLPSLCVYLIIIAGSTLLRMLFSFLTLLVSRSDGTLMVKDLRLRLGEHVRKLPLGFFKTNDVGGLSNKILENVNRIEMIITMLLPEMISLVVLNMLVVIGLFYIDYRLATAALVSLPVALGLLNVSRRIMDNQGKAIYQSAFVLSGSILEFVNGIKFIKLFNRSDKKLEDLIEKMDDFKDKSLKTEGALSPVMTLSGISIDFGFVMLIAIGSFLMIQGTLTGKTFLIFIIISSRFFENLKTMSVNYVKIKYLLIAGDTVAGIFKEKPLTGAQDSLSLPSHEIEFRNVRFSYDSSEVLRGIDLILPNKTMTAFVGPSGSGKTTLVNLIARFFDPGSGIVSIGGRRICDIDPEELLQEISIVFQNVFLFNDTIFNNIKIGKKDATKEEVLEAAEKANCSDFINHLPKGFDTVVGENGAILSGGEKQRISIARAILKDAPILLLDEATASLDSENEIKIQSAIGNLLKSRTIAVIAHRLKTIRYADNIVVLDNGRIREQGTHEDLMNNGDLYCKMWKTQQISTGWCISNNSSTIPGNSVEKALVDL